MAEMKGKRLPVQRDETPREREYRKQLNDLHTKLARQRENLNGQIEAMRRKHEAAGQALVEAQHLREINEELETRISAGIYRRTLLFHVACLLLKSEDDPTLTDEQADALLEEAIRHARTVVSMERIARAEDRERKMAREAAQKEGA